MVSNETKHLPVDFFIVCQMSKEISSTSFFLRICVEYRRAFKEFIWIGAAYFATEYLSLQSFPQIVFKSLTVTSSNVFFIHLLYLSLSVKMRVSYNAEAPVQKFFLNLLKAIELFLFIIWR